MSVEIIEGLPVPPEHPRFKKVSGGEVLFISSDVQRGILSGMPPIPTDDCRNCARCYWMDKANEINLTEAAGKDAETFGRAIADSERLREYAEMCRIWRK